MFVRGCQEVEGPHFSRDPGVMLQTPARGQGAGATRNLDNLTRWGIIISIDKIDGRLEVVGQISDYKWMYSLVSLESFYSLPG